MSSPCQGLLSHSFRRQCSMKRCRSSTRIAEPQPGVGFHFFKKRKKTLKKRLTHELALKRRFTFSFDAAAVTSPSAWQVVFFNVPDTNKDVTSKSRAEMHELVVIWVPFLDVFAFQRSCCTVHSFPHQSPRYKLRKQTRISTENGAKG